jgi:ATP-dependent Zn protease
MGLYAVLCDCNEDPLYDYSKLILYSIDPKPKDVDIQVIARGTPGFSGADLANLVNHAAIQASRDGCREVSMKHMEFAKDKILMGAERRSAYITDESKKMTAYHEGGHALVALYTPGAMPLHKATIMPRGASLGMVCTTSYVEFWDNHKLTV